MGSNAKERIQYWLQIFLVPVYGLSFLFPRNRKIWLFGSTFGRRFAENPRYLFLYVSQHKELGVRPVWISHKKEIVQFLTDNGYEAYYYHSLKGIWLALLAGVYIYDNYSKDINFWQSGGAIKINLWHGSGNKKINHDNMHDKIRHPKTMWDKWKTWLRRLSDEKPKDYVLTTSRAMQELYVSAFATDYSHVIVEGQPRNDTLFSEQESEIRDVLMPAEQELTMQLEKMKDAGNRILAYMPTFRDSEQRFFDVMDLPAFNDFLKSEHLILLTKLHVKSKLKQEFEKIHCSNILNVTADIDTYSFLKEVDLLITDYSSVYTDFMLLDRPVIAFQYDFAQYSQDTRECYIDHNEYMPEYKAYTMDDLENGIRTVLKSDIHKEARKRSRERMFATLDGKSSARITDLLLKMI